MAENAPENWQTFIFKLEQGSAQAGKQSPAVEYKVIAGSPGQTRRRI